MSSQTLFVERREGARTRAVASTTLARLCIGIAQRHSAIEHGMAGAMIETIGDKKAEALKLKVLLRLCIG